MSNFYTSNVKLVSNKLDYAVPDVRKISGTKYKWFPENKGKPNSLQAECCFEYAEAITPGGDISSITEQQYTDFAKVTSTVDKTEIQSDGSDGAIVSATFPEAGGKAIFTIHKPNVTDPEIVEVTIPASKIAILPKEKTSTNEKGTIRVGISSDTWQSVAGFGAISIESI